MPYLGATVAVAAAIAGLRVMNGFGNVLTITAFQRGPAERPRPAGRPDQLRRLPDLGREAGLHLMGSSAE